MRAIPRNRVNLPPSTYKIVQESLTQSKVICGDEIKIFEELFSSYIGVKKTIAISSARAGLMFVLKALGLKPGDEVIIPAYTFHVVPAVVKSLGLVPIFVDVWDDTYNLCVKLLEKKEYQRRQKPLLRPILSANRVRLLLL